MPCPLCCVRRRIHQCTWGENCFAFLIFRHYCYALVSALSHSLSIQMKMVSKTFASHVSLLNARDRKYLLVIVLFALFTVVHRLFSHTHSNDIVSNTALTFFFAWCAFRAASLLKNVVNFERISHPQSKAVFITGNGASFLFTAFCVLCTRRAWWSG